MAAKKAIIFDFDYTLGDSTNGIVLSVNYALEKLGYDTKKTEDIQKTIGLSLRDTCYTLTNSNDLTKAELFAKHFKDKADEVMVDNTILYSNVKSILHRLREHGYKIGIVTTKYHYRMEQILNRNGAMDLIDVIVGAEDVKVEKPDPEGLLYAIADLEIEQSEVLYVGDSLVDAKTAELANVDFAAVLTGTTREVKFKEYHPVCIGKDLSDVYEYVLAAT